MSDSDTHTLSTGSDEHRSEPTLISHSQPQFLDAVAKACEAIVEEYRHGRITKAQASRLLLSKLSGSYEPSGAESISEAERKSPSQTISISSKLLTWSDEQRSPTTSCRGKELRLQMEM